MERFNHVARLSEYHHLRSLRASGPHQGVADVPVNAAAVGYQEALLPLHNHTRRAKESHVHYRRASWLITSNSLE
jgi:hypothetical protein